MSNYPPSNPFSSPQHSGPPPQHPHVPQSNAKIIAPAVCLLVAAILGLGLAIFNVIMSFGPPAMPDPNVPQWIQDMEKASTGPMATVIQGAFVLWNSIIIFGSIQMLRIKSRGLGIAASIMSMVNFGSCCCIMGIPFGIWSLVILLQSDVIQKFAIEEKR